MAIKKDNIPAEKTAAEPTDSDIVAKILQAAANTGDKAAARKPAAAPVIAETEKTAPPAPVKTGENRKNTAAPRAKKRSGAARNPLIAALNFVFMLIAALIFAGVLALYGLKSLYQRPGGADSAQMIVIPAGSGINSIADLLEKQGLISHKAVFIYGAYLAGKAKLLKAGEYEIPAGAAPRDIADILLRGRGVQHSVTLPEGLTVAQVFAKLAAEPLLTGELPEKLPPEGSLIADTVRFARGAARRDIVRRLSAGQERLVQEIWAQRATDLPLKNREELIILASLVEKETGIAAERPHIAAVFYNRLRQNMRLQSDPTVLYGLFGGQGKPADRALFRADLEKETPYNTYKILGLPPTPICNPGRDSLLAAASPMLSADLYFVADGSGGHIFASSLSEHNANVAKWRAFKKARQEAAEAEKPALPPADKSAAAAAEENSEAKQAPAAAGGLIEETP